MRSETKTSGLPLMMWSDFSGPRLRVLLPTIDESTSALSHGKDGLFFDDLLVTALFNNLAHTHP